MPALLLLEALFELLHQLVPAAHGLDLGLLLVAEMEFRHLAQPFLGQLAHVEQLVHVFEALEDMAEHPVELVEVALVLHQGGATEVIEIVDTVGGEAPLHRFQ